MNAPRRPVKLKTPPGRAKPDTSRKLTVEPSGFVRNEWLETLSRIKADQPKRYAREVSAGLHVTVSKYEQLKAEQGRQVPARAEKRREVSAGTTRFRLKPKRQGGIGAPRAQDHKVLSGDEN